MAIAGCAASVTRTMRRLIRDRTCISFAAETRVGETAVAGTKGNNRRRTFAMAALVAAALVVAADRTALGSEPDATRAAASESERPSSLRAGAIIRDCEVCPELVVVPAGSFRMGDLTGGGDVDEGPVRTVTIPQAFAVARYETTFAEWDACAAAGACRQGVSDIGFGRDRRPVILVSWEDAQAYAGWLSRLSGKQYRLPSEAEWEYVARAGTETRYPWGDETGRGNANCDECGSNWDDEQTAPAGSFPANAFGVFDTVGNVYEWVADCGRYSYEGAPSDGSAAGPGDGRATCAWRMMRGGSWVSLPRASRPANRVRNPVGFNDINVGFRVARSL